MNVKELERRKEGKNEPISGQRRKHEQSEQEDRNVTIQRQKR
jgi:hypothetical protein